MTEPDPTLESLEELVLVGRANIANWLGLMERVDRVRELRAAGVSYRDMQLEEGMPIIQAISDNQDRLTAAAARFRRVAARELVDEGLSPAAIARSFGVSRQRVASLLAESDSAGAPPTDGVADDAAVPQ